MYSTGFKAFYIIVNHLVYITEVNYIIIIILLANLNCDELDEITDSDRKTQIQMA